MRIRFVLVTVLLASFSALPAIAQQWGRPRPPKTGACFYKEAYFRGEYFCLKVGERWPTMPAGFNDRISSIRVFRDARVRIFNDSDFRGINMRIDQDVDTLKNFSMPDNPMKNWNDRISSIAVYRDRDDFDRQHPR
jgi:Peptidase inhibitor family I36